MSSHRAHPLGATSPFRTAREPVLRRRSVRSFGFAVAQHFVRDRQQCAEHKKMLDKTKHGQTPNPHLKPQQIQSGCPMFVYKHLAAQSTALADQALSSARHPARMPSLGEWPPFKREPPGDYTGRSDEQIAAKIERRSAFNDRLAQAGRDRPGGYLLADSATPPGPPIHALNSSRLTARSSAATPGKRARSGVSNQVWRRYSSARCARSRL